MKTSRRQTIIDLVESLYDKVKDFSTEVQPFIIWVKDDGTSYQASLEEVIETTNFIIENAVKYFQEVESNGDDDGEEEDFENRGHFRAEYRKIMVNVFWFFSEENKIKDNHEANLLFVPVSASVFKTGKEKNDIVLSINSTMLN